MGSTATVTVLFCDLVGSTERLARLGDEAADGFRHALFACLRGAIASAGGVEVKNLGDGLMVVFERSAADALACAQDMHAGAAALDVDDPVRLRIGLSAGEVAQEEGDWFGTPVVEAARLCAVAAPGQTLAPILIRTLVGSRGRPHRFRDLGPIRLKGLPAEMSVVDVDGVEAPAPAPIPDTAVAAPPERPSRSRRRVALAAGAVVVVALVGAAMAASLGDDTTESASDRGRRAARTVTSPQGYRPEFRRRDCAGEVAASVPGAECGDLVVPELRRNPGGRAIGVPVVKVAAATAASEAPVVLFDVNEPIATTSLSEVADVYAISLRGLSAEADPSLDCPELRSAWSGTFASPTRDPATIARRVAASDACSARLRAEGVQLDGYTPAEAANDLRDLVAALDLGRVTVAAGGPTSVAAVTFARANPGAVASVLLSNPVPPGASPLGDPVTATAHSFRRVADACRHDESCHAKFPDLTDAYGRRLTALADRPIRVSTESLSGDGTFDVLLDGDRMAAAVETVLAQTSQIGLVPSAIVSASDELTAAAGIDEDVKRYVAGRTRAGAVLSYTCSYDARPDRTAEISSAAMPEFAGASDPTFGEMCRTWGVRSVYDDLAHPFTVDVPVLLAQGGLSVAGANDWAGAMAEQLPRATVVRMSTMSEDVAFSAPTCLRDLRNRFVVDPAARLDVSACEAQSPPITFTGLS